MNEMKFTEDHEWILPKESFALVGITNHAQENLGDIVFIELPQIGKFVNSGDQIGIVESVKAASDLISPASGEIIEVNNSLQKTPQIINSDPEDQGWYMKIKLNKIDELDQLMNSDQYNKFIK